MTFTELLADFETKCRSIKALNLNGMYYEVSDWDRVLLCLFQEYEKDICPLLLDGYFHKAFRQIDVTDSGYIDSAIHMALDNSKLWWHMWPKPVPKLKAAESEKKELVRLQKKYHAFTQRQNDS